jgi:hypothetical protein
VSETRGGQGASPARLEGRREKRKNGLEATLSRRVEKKKRKIKIRH